MFVWVARDPQGAWHFACMGTLWGGPRFFYVITDPIPAGVSRDQWIASWNTLCFPPTWTPAYGEGFNYNCRQQIGVKISTADVGQWIIYE
jgi:hypothetical protein